jgi:hypothetical protein
MNFFLRKDLGIHKCSECEAPLEDNNFMDCGLVLVSQSGPRVVYFDFVCPSCAYHGRWTFPIPDEMPAWEIAKDLAACFIQTPDEMYLLDKTESERRDIASKLTKINSVEDLLKLGGSDAPREPSKRDRNP